MKTILSTQYNAVQSARSVLLDYCESISPKHFVIEVNGFGRGGSIRNLLVHNGTTYQYWIGKHLFNREMLFPSYESIKTIDECRAFYQTIDALVAEFLDYFSADYFQEISSVRNNEITVASPLKVFTHVTTHEFHHKGQMLTMSRLLGYTPIDTDVIRAE